MRFAHFSDTHLLSLDGVKLFEFANKRWIGGLNMVTRRRHHDNAVFEALVGDLNRQGADHAICTGDVTNFALDSEFRFARRMLGGLNLGPDAITIVPGNHDSYVPRGQGGFYRELGCFATADDGFVHGAADDRWPVVRIRGPLAIIGLSSSHPSPWFMAHGKLGPVQLERLDRILKSPKLAGKARVVALHHPPVGRTAQNPMRGLRDRADLLAILARRGAEMVLHGHMHRDVTYSLSGPNGTIPVRGITSASYRTSASHSRAAYRIYEVRPGDDRPVVAEVTTRYWSTTGGSFAAL